MLVPLYVATMGLSAFLLFLIQPMFAKMALPLLGGSPLVWNVAMVFFQGTLLLGYLYAHLSHRWLPPKQQKILHLVILLIPLVSLPIGLAAGWTPDVSNLAGLWLIAMMAASIGLPFFAISTTAPVLQSWFAQSEHKDAANPYFLFAASNLGSILALFSYPFVIEPWLKMQEQSYLWSWLYGFLMIMIAVCAWQVWSAIPNRRTVDQGGQEDPKVAWRQRLHWTVLAFIPSGLLLATTQHISTDVAPIPLLWVFPLSLYLLTFAIAFARRTWIPNILIRIAFPLALTALSISFFWRLPVFSFAIPIFFGGFFVVALYFHSRLAAIRPAASRLTDFYLFMSIGGVLGGIFAALLAPLVFDRILEFPLLLILAAFFHQSVLVRKKHFHWLDLILCLGLAGAIALPLMIGLTDKIGVGLFAVKCLAIALVLMSLRRIPLAAGVLATVIIFLNTGMSGTEIIHRDRGNFGVLKVEYVSRHKVNKLVHGTTMHGAQSTEASKRRNLTTYYHDQSPLNKMIRALKEDGWPQRAGVAGMGVGTMACIAEPGQKWTIYEIDPVVIKTAQNTDYFHYLDDCFKDGEIKLGDARLSIAQEKPNSFDLLILDTFTSDAIPTHMLTKEAIAMYFDKLNESGVLAIHVSNWHFDLKPVLATVAKELGLVAAYHPLGTDVVRTGNFEQDSEWIVVARTRAQLEKMASKSRWVLLLPKEGDPLWTDDYSSLARIIFWRGRPLKAPWQL